MTALFHVGYRQRKQTESHSSALQMTSLTERPLLCSTHITLLLRLGANPYPATGDTPGAVSLHKPVSHSATCAFFGFVVSQAQISEQFGLSPNTCDLDYIHMSEAGT